MLAGKSVSLDANALSDVDSLTHNFRSFALKRWNIVKLASLLESFSDTMSHIKKTATLLLLEEEPQQETIQGDCYNIILYRIWPVP